MSKDQSNPPEGEARSFFGRLLRRNKDEQQAVKPATDSPERPDEAETGSASEPAGVAREETPGESAARTAAPVSPEPTSSAAPATAPESAAPPSAVAPPPAPSAPPVPPAPRSDLEVAGASELAAVSMNEQDKPRKKKEPGRFRRALSRTGQGLASLLLGKKAISDELLEELETLLLMADVGVEATTEIIDTLTERVRRKELNDSGALFGALRQLLIEMLQPCEQNLVPEGHKPFVLLVVGVNGVGKTTTIGKMAKRYLGEGKSVVLAAGDTFRAAAVEQLQVWGQRNHVPVIAQHTGADSASVIFDAISSGQKRGADLVIADTAGRLHNKANLMEELAKVGRVMRKLDASAPHEVLLVLDATTGQNAVRQMAQFGEAINVTGIALTKLDGTAKGGVIFALCRAFGKPVRFVGLGEGIEDLQPFSAEAFVDGLLGELADK